MLPFFVDFNINKYKINIVNKKEIPNMNIEDQIQMTLDKIRPFIQRDGGDVIFDSFIDGIVYLSLVGACEGCSMINETLQDGIGMILKEEVPGVIDVRAVSDKPTEE